MLRTQISLTREERQLLDGVATRTGRSISALIRDAVHQVYGQDRSAEEDIARMREAFGSWQGRDFDGETFVEGLRSGRRIRLD